jgi:hypothetical protein
MSHLVVFAVHVAHGQVLCEELVSHKYCVASVKMPLKKWQRLHAQVEDEGTYSSPPLNVQTGGKRWVEGVHLRGLLGVIS